MSTWEKLLDAMRNNPGNVRFADLSKVCDRYFGEPRSKSGSHRKYKTPWRGDPRVNIQDFGGKAKEYQVRQVLEAIDRIEENKHGGESEQGEV